jgi:hypothetical protein
MHYEIQKKINELHKALRENAPRDAVSFRLFINGSETSVEMVARTPEQLKGDGISMRNLAGDFISA